MSSPVPKVALNGSTPDSLDKEELKWNWTSAIRIGSDH